MGRALIRLFVAANLGIALSALAFAALPDDLDVKTDIVGYPTYANFNINSYFWAYGITVVVFPLTTFGIYLALTRVLAPAQGPRGPLPPLLERVETVPPARSWRAPLVAAGRTLLVGGVLGLEIAIIVAFARPLALLVGSVVCYGAVVGLLALGSSRLLRRNPLEVVSIVNTLAAPLAVALLYGVSESTQVTVSQTGAVHPYPWLPVWIAAAVTAGVLLWLGRALVRSRTGSRRSDLERRALLLVVAPVGLFLLVAYLPGELGTVNLYEEGQILAAAELTRDGAFPWRDLFLVHGLLHDIGTGLLGSSVIEDSRWGVVAGEKLLILPLSWIALYYLCVYLFGSNWLFLLGTQLLVVAGSIFAIHYRFALIPFVLLLLAALLHRPTVVRAVAFTTLLFVQTIVTPEALGAAPAYIFVLILFELYYRDRRERLGQGFRRTLLVLGSASVLAVGWSIFLAAHGALDDFGYSYRAFVSGHQLMVGVPIGTYSPTLKPANIGQRYEELATLAPIALVLGAILFFVARTRLRRSLTVQDWVMLAAVAFVLPYYAKYLDRSDHIYHVFAMALPVLLYAIYRVLTFAESAIMRSARRRGALWFPPRHVLTLPLLLVLLATAPVTLRDVPQHLPSRYAVEVGEEPEMERLGYAKEGESDVGLFREVGRALDLLVEPGEAVFDFSNTPGLAHHLLDRPPSTRYYHVSVAIPQQLQADLVRRLEQARPEVVIFSASIVDGAPAVWDKVPNQVRHYDVSEYLLDRYVPVLESRRFVLMRRREDGVRAQPELYFDVAACDWGYVPNFFAPAPERDDEASGVTFRRLGPTLRIRGWAVDPVTKTPAREVVASLGGNVVARVRPDQYRSDVAFALNEPGYGDSGFGIALPLRGLGRAELETLRVEAIMRSGDAKELTPPTAVEQTGLELTDEPSAPASESPGAVEAVGVEEPLALTLPADASTYRWLEIRTSQPLAGGSFELSDKLDESPLGPRTISFKTLARGESVVRLRIGACSQWRGYRTDTVYLMPSAGQDIREIRLLR